VFGKFKVEGSYFNETTVEKLRIIQGINPEDSLIHLICEFRSEPHGKCISACLECCNGIQLSVHVEAGY
jgi:hypothetical protein